MAYIPKQGDLVFLRVGDGQSERGTGLVMSHKSFNHASGLAWVAPITSEITGSSFEILLAENGVLSGAIIPHLARVVDYKARGMSRAERAPESATVAALEVFDSLFN